MTSGVADECAVFVKQLNSPSISDKQSCPVGRNDSGLVTSKLDTVAGQLFTLTFTVAAPGFNPPGTRRVRLPSLQFVTRRQCRKCDCAAFWVEPK